MARIIPNVISVTVPISPYIFNFVPHSINYLSRFYTSLNTRSIIAHSVQGFVIDNSRFPLQPIRVDNRRRQLCDNSARVLSLSSLIIRDVRPLICCL